MVKNLPCDAGDVGSIPGWGTKSPHTTEQLNILSDFGPSISCSAWRAMTRIDIRQTLRIREFRICLQY